MLTSKHVIVAMIVAPVLAVLAWIAVGQLAGEKAAAARPGENYPLVEQSNCRYPSGACDLHNQDFKLRLTVEDSSRGLQMVLSASHPLDGVVLSVAIPDSDQPPAGMRAEDGRGLEWRAPLEAVPGSRERIRLVARAQGSSYFGEASTTFLEPGDNPAN